VHGHGAALYWKLHQIRAAGMTTVLGTHDLANLHGMLGHWKTPNQLPFS